MNDELGNFIIKFTTEGFDKVEKSLDALNEGMDKLNDSFEKANSKGESFFGALLKWDIVVGTITKSFRALKDEISAVFDTAEDMTTLFRKEQSLGVEAKVLERYGLLAKLNQGSEKDAYAFFEGVQDLMLKASTPALWSMEDQKGLTLAGIDWSYKQLSSDRMENMVLNRNAYLEALRQAFVKNMDDPDRMSMLKKYVGQDSLYSAFMAPNESFYAQMDWAEKHRVLSKEPEGLQKAQDLRVEMLEWGQFKKLLDTRLMPVLSDLLKALEPLQEPLLKMVDDLGKWIGKNSENIAKWVEDAAKWVANELPGKVKKVIDCLVAIGDALLPIVKFVGDKLLGTVSWFSDAWDVLFKKDGITSEEFVKKYGGDSKAGGIAGMLFRGMEQLVNLAATPASQVFGGSTTNNINQGDTVVVEAGWHDRTIINPRTAPTGAMMASMYKQ